jgi:short-subunit dehydrogenase
MPDPSSDWLSRFSPARFRGDRAAVHAAREAVAGLKPAVVITGGSRGIGLALAQRFIEAARETAIVARSAPGLAEAVAEIKSATGFEATAILCDVSEPNAADIIAAELSRAGLYLDVLVNNAGIGLAGPFVTHTPAEISRLIALNVETVTRLTRAALPDMLARQRGGVLNVASLGGAIPGPNQAVHYASKSYVISLTEAVASETFGQGVRVAVVLPGPVSTDFHKDMGADRSPYRWIVPAMSPRRVARSAYFGFMIGRRVIVPGLFNAAFYLTLRVLPHTLTVPIVHWLLWRPKGSGTR